jgi:hypothetical protein
MPLHILNADGGKSMSRHKRKVELGSCARPYGTPCQHEHACIRCPMLNVNPKMIGRLNELEADLLACRERAHAEGWSAKSRASTSRSPFCEPRETPPPGSSASR